MDKRTKIWLIVAATLLVSGCLIFGGVMTMLKWDFSRLSTVKFETNDYVITEGYKNISIETDTADIKFLPAEDGQSKVVCYEQKDMAHSVEVVDGTLVIRLVDTRKWYQYIGINFASPTITVYLPEAEYGTLLINESTGDVNLPNNFSFESIGITVSTGDIESYASASKDIKIKASTGDIRVEKVSADAIDLSVSTGRVILSDTACEGEVKVGVSTGKAYLTDVKCKNLTSSGNTGDISLKNVVAAEKLSIVRSTGDVDLEKCDAAEIFIETDTGDVKGSLLSDKVFIANTDTGRIDVPKTTTGGKCEITTDTGDIRIDVAD